MARKLKIACFEGTWNPDMRKRQSVLPVLQFLEHVEPVGYFHRPVASKDQFLHDIRAWARQSRYSDYEVAFIATHGDSERLWFGKDEVLLKELQEHLRGELKGRIVYFGSCSTASDEWSRSRRFKAVLNSFRETTAAAAVCGYVNDVDFSESAAFEILLFAWLADYTRRTAALDFIEANYKDLISILGFCVSRRPSRRKASQAA